MGGIKYCYILAKSIYQQLFAVLEHWPCAYAYGPTEPLYLTVLPLYNKFIKRCDSQLNHLFLKLYDGDVINEALQMVSVQYCHLLPIYAFQIWLHCRKFRTYL